MDVGEIKMLDGQGNVILEPVLRLAVWRYEKLMEMCKGDFVIANRLIQEQIDSWLESQEDWPCYG